MGHIIFKLFLVGAFLSVSVAGIGAGLTSLTYKSVLDEGLSAVDNQDIAVLEGRIDWPNLRANLKESIRAQQKAVKSLNIGAMSSGPPAEKIDEIVEYYARPENFKVLFKLKEKHFSTAKAADFVHSSGLSGPFSWSVTFGLPVTKKEKGLSDERQALVSRVRSALEVSVIFTLDGLTWKISRVQVPLFLVPDKTYNKPLTEVYNVEDQK